MSTIKKSIEDAQKEEKLESINTILIGLDQGGGYKSYLENYKNDIGFTQFEYIGIDEKAFAKLADFVSKSISSTSSALGTGSPSASLSF